MKQIAVILIILYLSSPFTAFAEKDFIVGKVVKVVDGDTIHVLENKTRHKISLAYIDAPEKKQAFGKKSHHILASQIAGKEIRCQVEDIDRYKRIIGLCQYQEAPDLWINISTFMVGTGYAWVYRKYNKDVGLELLEMEAKKEKRGLWADPAPIEPWIWRKRTKE